MLENQIPFLILSFLFEILFPKVFKKIGGENTVKKLALSLLGYNKESVQVEDTTYGFHFLELIHSFIDKEDESAKNEDGMDVRHEKLELKRCISMLEAAGVKINPVEAEDVSNSPTNHDRKLRWLFWKTRAKSKKCDELERQHAPKEIRFDLKITFKDGILKIPPLHITKTTEAKWRNLIAWELNRTQQEKLIDPKGETRINCKFISYALFFQNLICCVHDVQLLQDRNVIKVHEVERNKNKMGKKKVMSNEELVKLFGRITEGVPNDKNYMDCSFWKLFRDLNGHSSTVDGVTERRKFVWHYFRRLVTWIWLLCKMAYRVLRRDHIPTGWKLVAVLAGTTGLALAAVQTAYTIISFQKSAPAPD